jgi:hypothetical protein
MNTGWPCRLYATRLQVCNSGCRSASRAYETILTFKVENHRAGRCLTDGKDQMVVILALTIAESVVKVPPGWVASASGLIALAIQQWFLVGANLGQSFVELTHPTP